MKKIEKISLAQRRWAEDSKHYVEPVIRVRYEDGSKTDFCFRWANFGAPISVIPGVFFLIDQQIVWSSVRKSTVVERYVIQVQRAGQEPQTLQSFRLYTIGRGKIERPTHWMWNEGPIDDKFADERKSNEPINLSRRWDRGPEQDFVVLD